MKSNVLFAIITTCILSMMGVWAWAPQEYSWIGFMLGGVALLTLLFLLYNVIIPKNVAQRGMELISAQDFNNRLVKTGEHDADKMVVIFNTMIDKLRSERLLKQEQENLMHRIINASPMGVMMLDFDYRIAMVNPSFLRLTGIDDESMILGQFPEEVNNSLVREMHAVKLGKNEVIRDGDIRTYRCYHLNFIELGFHREFYMLESFTEEVMKAERNAYEKVIRTISHEVNNTMGGVRTVLGMISDSTDDEEMVRVIESCDTRCDHMCSFVSTYADVVRVPEPVMQSVDLNEEISKLVPFAKMTIKEGVDFEFIPADQPAMAQVDCDLLQQVLVNIIKNANESISRDKGKIIVAVRKQRDSVMVEIANDGEPITDEVSQQLFCPFFTTKRDGRGIGLTLTSEILTRHHARFRLATGNDGITRFTILFKKEQ